MSYFTEDLIASIKNRSLAPISQATFTESDLLALASEELRTKLVSDLIKIREDFLQTHKIVPLEAGIAYYAIPERAVGDALKSVSYVEPSGQVRPPLPRGDSTDEGYYSITGGMPTRFYLEGDEVVLIPKPLNSAGSLKMVYPMRPSKLIATSGCAKITAVSYNSTTASFTVNTDLTASLSVGDKIDFVSAKSPFKCWAIDAVITQITDTLIECAVSSVVDANGSVQPETDDYICPAGFSNIPQIPIEMHSVLAQMTVVKLMESLGDRAKMEAAKVELREMRSEVGLVTKNRVESTPQRANRRTSIRKFFR